jgi:cytidine deaminase
MAHAPYLTSVGAALLARTDEVHRVQCREFDLRFGMCAERSRSSLRSATARTSITRVAVVTDHEHIAPARVAAAR